MLVMSIIGRQGERGEEDSLPMNALNPLNLPLLQL